MMENTGFNKVRNLQIVSLLMSEAGTYNPQQNRPYETNMPTQMVKLLTDRVMDSPDHKVNGAMLAGITNNFIAPTATPESEIQIINGWSGRRIRFILKMRCELAGGNIRMYYIQGFTSHSDISYDGSIARDMVFYVNSIIQTRIMNVPTPMGVQVYETAFENSHILMDDKFSNLRGANNTRLMRPQDVFSSMQASHIPDTYGGGTMIDSRSMLHKEATKSRRGNGLGATYAASILNGYANASQSISLGANQQEIYSQSMSNVIENPAALDPFLMALTQVTSEEVSNKFTYENLRTLDANVDHVTNYQVLGPTQQANLHQAGSTSYWHGSNRMTQVATMISQAVPSMMIDLMLTKVYLESNNYAEGGVMDTRLITAESLTGGDQTRNYNIFINRLEEQLFKDMTYAGSETYGLKLEVNLIGDTRLSLSLSGGPFEDFVTPSFCDSLMVPVVTSNPETIGNLVNDFEQLTNSIHEAVGESMGHSVINNDAFSQINHNF